jgi:hypothetical protein
MLPMWAAATSLPPRCLAPTSGRCAIGVFPVAVRIVNAACTVSAATSCRAQDGDRRCDVCDACGARPYLQAWSVTLVVRFPTGCTVPPASFGDGVALDTYRVAVHERALPSAAAAAKCPDSPALHKVTAPPHLGHDRPQSRRLWWTATPQQLATSAVAEEGLVPWPVRGHRHRSDRLT